MATSLKKKPIALLISFVLIILLSPTGFTDAQTCTPPPAGLIGWWTGDTDGSDISGNSNDALLQNGALANQTGMVNSGFSFNGVNAIAETTVQLGAQGTIDLWANPAQLTNLHTLIGTFGLAGGDDRLWLTTNPTQLLTNLGSSSVDDIIVPTPLVVGTWTHLAVTFDFDADDYHLFVNGTEIASSTTPRTAPTGVLKFGGIDSDFGQSFFFNGLIDEVEVFNRVLEEDEIKDIFDAGSAGKCRPELIVKFALVKFSGKSSYQETVKIQGEVALTSNSDGFDLLTEPVVLVIGQSELEISPESFMLAGNRFVFEGTINGAQVAMTVRETQSDTYRVAVTVKHLELTGELDPLPLLLTIGDDFWMGKADLKGLLISKPSRRGWR